MLLTTYYLHRPEHESAAPGSVYLKIVTALAACGYEVRGRVLPASAFGLPQHRDRLYFVGFRDSASCERFVWPTSALPGVLAEDVDAAASVNGVNGVNVAVSAAGGVTGATIGSILEEEGSIAVQAAALSREQWAKVRLSNGK